MDLGACRSHLLPALWGKGLDKFDLRTSEMDDCVYAQSVSDPECKVLVAYRNEIEDMAFEVIADRIEYLRRRYGS